MSSGCLHRDRSVNLPHAEPLLLAVKMGFRPGLSMGSPRLREMRAHDFGVF